MRELEERVLARERLERGERADGMVTMMTMSRSRVAESSGIRSCEMRDSENY